jgi:hypothetical protein
MSLMGQIQQVNLPTEEAVALPSTFGGIVSKAARQTWLNFNSTSSEAALSESDAWQAEQYKEATGEDISELYPTPQEYEKAAAGGLGLTQGGGLREYVNNKLDVLRAENPDMFNSVPTFADQQAKAADIANKSTDDLMEAQYFTKSKFPGVAGFVGGLGGAVVDPVNLATMPFGGGGKTVLQLMFREALVGGATELALQPAIMKWQKEIGQEYGLDEAAANVIFGMAGAAGLSGMFRGASVAYDKLANHYIDNEVLNAGFKQLSIDAHLKENDPSTTVYGSRSHLEAVDFGQRALDNGFIPEARQAAKGNEVEFAAKQDIEHVDLVERARAEGIDFDSDELEDFIVRHLQKTEPIFTPVPKPDKVKYTGRIQEDQDELLVAIAKAGGISREDASSQGIDPASFGLQSSRIKRTFTSGGKSLDDMAEHLSQYGYFKGKYSANELLRLVTDSLGGSKHYTPEGFASAAKRAEADEHTMRFGDAESEYLDQLLTNVVDDFALSAREINADINSRPAPTEIEYTNFNQVLTDNEIFPELRSKEAISNQLDELDNPEVEAAALSDFERNVEANGDDIIYMDDGSTINIRDLQAKFKEDEQALADITSCSIGGGE